MKLFTKQSLKAELKEIRNKGWIKSTRPGNDGGVGNTLEDMLGLPENNLPLPNAGEWEIKGQRADTTSLITLFHMEPSPRACRFVPRILLPNYGWKHSKAGDKHPANEMSFRQTLTAGQRTNRGFTVLINQEIKRIEISFSYEDVDMNTHGAWLDSVKKRAGLEDLNPRPYWGFTDLYCKAGTKLQKTFYAIADRKRSKGVEYFRYQRFLMLQDFTMSKLIETIRMGNIQIEFDARTGHNHGTKFRLKQNYYTQLYDSVIEF